MYNITVGSIHPSVICVEISNLAASLTDMRDLLSTDYIEDGLKEFIGTYARTDEIMPTDKTVGFVVLNTTKKIISLSFSSLEPAMKTELQKITDSYREIGYSADLDIS